MHNWGNMEYTICPNCHSKINKLSRFCQVCGKELVSLNNDSEELVCPQCETVNKPGSLFCKHCGGKLEQKPKKDPFTGLKTEYDNFIKGEIEALQSKNLPLFSFMQCAEERSKAILLQIEQIKKNIYSIPESSFSTECINHIEKEFDNCRKIFWDLCVKRNEQSKEESIKSSLVDLSLSSPVFIGKAEAVFVIFGRTFPINYSVNFELLFKNNLIVRFNSQTEKTGVDMVSTIIGRCLKESQGKIIKITVIDTQDFWGLGSAFTLLNDEISHLISDEHSALQELEELFIYEQNVIRAIQSAQTPTALEYNKSHSDIIPAYFLIIKHFPQEVISNLDLIRRIMRHGAKSGVCVVLMVNDDELSFPITGKPSKTFDLAAWMTDAKVFDFIQNQFPFIPNGISFAPDILNEAELSCIVDEVNCYISSHPIPISINIKDYLALHGRALSLEHNLSLLVGVDRKSFASKLLVLNDMVVGNSLLICGSEDSTDAVQNWMMALAVYSLTRYPADSLNIVFCDYSDSDSFSCLFHKLHNVRILKKPRIRMLLSEESEGRRLVFVSGINAADEKEVSILEGMPNAVKQGTHFIIEDTCGVIKSWKGQKLVFGPAELRNGGSLSEQEFVFDNHICRRFRIDNDTIKEIIVSILMRYPNLTHEKILTPPVLQNIIVDEPKSASEEETPEKAEDAMFSEEVKELDQEGPLYLSQHLLPKEKRWTYSSANGLEIPIGINPWKDDVVTNLIFSQIEGQNAAFVIGKSGTGKSSLLHTIILNAAYKYSPSSLQLYLVDLSGVEFQYYATYKLPHAALVAPQAEREFAMSILDEVEEEAKRREERFSKEGERDFSSVTDLPRILLIIDEFQSLFDFDDEICSRSKGIIDRIVNKYRKFGINLLLATQKLPGSTKLDYSLINNRIVFDCRQDDYTTLFGPLNRQPSLGKGECLYTSKGRLHADVRENEIKSYYAAVDELTGDGTPMVEQLIGDLLSITPEILYAPPRVFIKDREVIFCSDRMHNDVAQEEFPDEVNLYLGEPVATGLDVTLTFDCSAQDNLLIVGGKREVAEGIAIYALLSAADAYIDGSITCFILSFMKKKAVLNHSASTFLCGVPFSKESREIPREEFVSFIKDIRKVVEERQKDFRGEYHHIFLLFLEYQNSGIDSDVKKTVDFILKNGPQFGVFTVMQAGTLGSLRDRGADKDNFNHRIALQMSKEESRDLMGGSNKAAFLNDLSKDKSPGLQRAYYFNKAFSNQQIKFRPYSYQNLIVE